MKIRKLVPLLALPLVTLFIPTVQAASMPSGERAFGQATLEPAYDAAHAGVLTYLLTPNKSPDPVKSNPKSWAPIYVVVYPKGSTAASTFSCNHMPVENCPSHGDLVAGAAMGISQQAGFGSVYENGVAGHDHVLDVPGGDDFNIAWEPVLVLFTTADAANTHLLTDAAIKSAADAHSVILVDAPQLTFHCSVVNVAVWNHGTQIVD
jgi:hypothetical protein